jgi:hypothetical protein
MRVQAGTIGLLCALAATGSMAQTVTGSGNANTVPAFASSPSTGNSTVTNSPISISGSNVGIGTTNPRASLDISNSVSGGVGPELILENSAAQANDKARISFVDVGTRAHFEWNIFPGGSPTLNYYDDMNSASRLFIDQNGNVGIGTTSPGDSLSVAGVDGTINNGGYIGTKYLG